MKEKDSRDAVRAKRGFLAEEAMNDKEMDIIISDMPEENYKPENIRPEMGGDSLKKQIKIYRCRTCWKGYCARNSYLRHRRQSCNSFSSTEKPRAIISNEHDILSLRNNTSKMFKCQFCCNMFTSLSTYRRHVTQKSCNYSIAYQNLPTKAKLLEDGKKENPYMCSVCCKSFENKSNYKRHMEKNSCKFSITRKMSYKCSKCDKCFLYKKSFVEHLNQNLCTQSNVIEFDSQPLETEKLLKCYKCKKSFVYKHNYYKHLIHKKCKTLPLGKNNKIKYDLQKSPKLIEGVKPYMCNVCGVGFFSSSKLNRHYGLNRCNSFVSNQGYHTRSSSHKVQEDAPKDRLFSCGLCGREFHYKKNLYRHLRLRRCNATFVNQSYQEKPLVQGVIKDKVFTRGKNNDMQKIYADKETTPCNPKFKKQIVSSKTNKQAVKDDSVTCIDCKKCFLKEKYLKQHKQLNRCKVDLNQGQNKKSFYLDIQDELLEETKEEKDNLHSVQQCHEDQCVSSELTNDILKFEAIEGNSFISLKQALQDKPCLKEKSKENWKRKQVKCHLCGRGFFSKSNLNKHQRLNRCKVFLSKEHREKYLSSEKEVVQPEETPIDCSGCGTTFLRKKYLIQHRRLNRCKRTLIQGLQVLSVLPVIKEEIQNEKPLKCSGCGVRFLKEIFLIQHKKFKRCKTAEVQTFEELSCSSSGLPCSSSGNHSRDPCVPERSELSLEDEMIDKRENIPLVQNFEDKTYVLETEECVAKEEAMGTDDVLSLEHIENVHMQETGGIVVNGKSNSNTPGLSGDVEIVALQIQDSFSVSQCQENAITLCEKSSSYESVSVDHNIKEKPSCQWVPEQVNTEKPNHCQFCGQNFSCKSNLNKHQMLGRCKLVIDQKKQELQSKEEPVNCIDCGTTFLKKRYLIQHRRLNRCKRTLTQGSKFTSVSQVMQEEVEKEKVVKCSDCDTSFLNKKYLTQHKRLNRCNTAEDQTFEEQSITSDTQVKSHIKKPISCKDCGKLFLKRKYLNQQKRCSNCSTTRITKVHQRKCHIDTIQEELNENFRASVLNQRTSILDQTTGEKSDIPKTEASSLYNSVEQNHGENPESSQAEDYINKETNKVNSSLLDQDFVIKKKEIDFVIKEEAVDFVIKEETVDGYESHILSESHQERSGIPQIPNFVVKQETDETEEYPPLIKSEERVMLEMQRYALREKVDGMCVIQLFSQNYKENSDRPNMLENIVSDVSGETYEPVSFDQIPKEDPNCQELPPGLGKRGPKKCYTCGKSFSSKSNLNRHFKLKRCKVLLCQEYQEQAFLPMLQEELLKDKPISCKDCGKHFLKVKYLKQHKHLNRCKYLCNQFQNAQKGNKVAGTCSLCVIGKLCECKNVLFHEHREVAQLLMREKPYSCNICGSAFRYRASYYKHLKGKKCTSAITRENEASSSSLTISGIGSHQSTPCTHISLENISKDEMNNTDVNEPGDFNRRDCDEFKYQTTCKLASSRNHHVESIETEQLADQLGKPYNCQMCGKGFLYRKNLKRHLELDRCKYSILHQGLQDQRNKRKSYKCYVCGKGFLLKCDYEKHKKLGKCNTLVHSLIPYANSGIQGTDVFDMKTKNTEFIEDSKTKDFNKEKVVKKDVKNKEDKKIEEDVKKDVDVNKDMGKNNEVSALKNHYSGTDVTCPVCRMNFSSEAVLECHIGEHLYKKTIDCLVCAEKFLSRLKRSNHLKKCHAEIECCTCNICKKTIEGYEDLKKHLQEHDGPIFKCPVCDKMLTKHFYLKNHLKLHIKKFNYRHKHQRKKIIPWFLKIHEISNK